jgi:hypothetical protein
MDLDVPRESAHVLACPDSHLGLLLYEAARTARLPEKRWSVHAIERHFASR